AFTYSGSWRHAGPSRAVRTGRAEYHSTSGLVAHNPHRPAPPCAGTTHPAVRRENYVRSGGIPAFPRSRVATEGDHNLNLFQLFLARRVRSRRDVEATDTGLAQRLQRALWEVRESLGSYLWDTS